MSIRPGHAILSTLLAVLSLVAGLGCGSTDTAPAEPPAVPAGVAASPLSSSTVLVSWDASMGATGYKVQRALDASGAPGAWGATAVHRYRSHGQHDLLVPRGVDRRRWRF
jgi:hypothetical protein